MKLTPMNCMATGHLMTSHPTREQILLTHRTTAHILPRLAIVIVKQQCINAHPAIFAVSKVLPPAHATKPTFFAMVGKLVRSHPQVANVAVIRSKLNVAIDTIVGFARLSRVALSTNDFGNGKSIDVVMGFLFLKVRRERGTTVSERECGGGRSLCCWHFHILHSCIGTPRTKG
jgi:hypothetical protein